MLDARPKVGILKHQRYFWIALSPAESITFMNSAHAGLSGVWWSESLALLNWNSWGWPEVRYSWRCTSSICSCLDFVGDLLGLGLISMVFVWRLSDKGRGVSLPIPSLILVDTFAIGVCFSFGLSSIFIIASVRRIQDDGLLVIDRSAYRPSVL